MVKMKVAVWLFVGFAAAVVVIILSYHSQSQLNSKNPKINSFNDCVAAGYPLTGSYPRQCRVPSGKIFIDFQAVVECVSDQACPLGERCLNHLCQK